MKPDKTETNAAPAMQGADTVSRDIEAFPINLMVKTFGNWALGFTWCSVIIGGAHVKALALYARLGVKEPHKRVVASIPEAFDFFVKHRVPARHAGKLMAEATRETDFDLKGRPQTNGGAPMLAPDKGPETALDLLTLALPYVEDAESDPAYKKGIVAILTKRMRAMIEAPENIKTATAALIANLYEFHRHGNPKIHFGALADDFGEERTTIGDLVTLAHCEQHAAPKIAAGKMQITCPRCNLTIEEEAPEPHLQAFIEAANAIEAAWETGDLGAACRELMAVRDEAKGGN